MKHCIIPFTVLVCTIATTIPGQSHSTQTTPVIKIANLVTLQQRTGNKKIPFPELMDSLEVLSEFKDRTFTSENLVEQSFDTIAANYFSRLVKEKLFLASLGSKEYHFKATSDPKYLELKNAYDKEIIQLKPVVLEILLQDDYPHLLAQIPAYQKKSD